MITVYNSIPDRYGAGREREAPGSDPRMRVTVVFTGAEATLCALRTAGALAKSLEARVALLAVEVVSIQLPIDQPLVRVDFLEQRLPALVSKSGLEVDEVSIDIYLSRDRKECLQQILRPRSLVIIGGKRGRWSRERKLEQWLSQFGHQVVFVDIAATRGSQSSLRSHCDSILRTFETARVTPPANEEQKR